MRRVPWLILALPLVLAAKPTSYDDPETLLRQADAAYEAGRFDRAADLYDRAGVRTTEPARAAFNLATARYRQAKEGQLAALGEAEVNYRACLRPGCEFRARALYGLGNCLLIRAEGATLDRATLRAAIDRYTECIAADDDDGLKADARHNRMKARLLLLQAPPPADGREDEPPQGDE
jgi:tetratricopeptide (TPR) repeat protein